MNNYKNKILLAGVVTIFAFLVTIGSTYAWFTVGRTSTIGPIEMSVKTDTSLLILLDNGYTDVANHDFLVNPSNYLSALSNDDFTGIYDFTNITLSPITTTNGLNFTLKNGDAASSSDAVLTPGQYLEFSVWLLSQQNTVTVAMRNLSVTASSGTALQNIVTDAVRVSTFPDGGSSAQIYGLDKDYAFTYLVGQTGYDSIIPENNVIVPATATALGLLHEDYYLSSGTPVASQSTDDLASATTVVTLTADVPSKVTIRIWIEGWDADCTNNLFNSHFIISYDFVVKAVVI